jgi:regulator of sigma E protease
MTIIIAILIFALIILIHEIGHFSAAKLFDMKVISFNMGMGPVLLKKQGKETVYQLKAVPFGGSCVLGEDLEPTDDPRDFRNKPVWQRMIVILAGAFMNLVLGFVLCLIIVSMDDLVGTTTIHSFTDSYETFSNQSLQANDKIIAVNGMRIFTVQDVNYQLMNSASKLSEDANRAVFEFTVMRNGQRITLENVEFGARTNEDGGKSIAPEIIWLGEQKTVFNVISASMLETISYSRIIVLTLGDLIRGTYGLNDISGPVGVVNVIGQVSSTGFAQSIKAGLMMTLYIAAFISINVGIFNLLPVPALDGSRFLFFVIEAIRRKPVKAEVENMVHFVGLAALMVFMLFITVLDVRGLFG